MVCQLPKYFRYIISRIEKEGLTERGGLRTIPTLRGVISPTLARGILCPT